MIVWEESLLTDKRVLSQLKYAKKRCKRDLYLSIQREPIKIGFPLAISDEILIECLDDVENGR